MRRFHALIALLALTSCTTAETKTANELRSDLRSALSLASETDLFIQQIETGRLLPEFQKGHSDYLRAEALREANEARDSEKRAKDSRGFALCAEQLGLLSVQLASISRSGDHDMLEQAHQHVEHIRKKLIVAGARR